MINKYYQILNDRRALWSSIVGQKKGGEELFEYSYEDYFFANGTWTAPVDAIEGSVKVHGIGGGERGAIGNPGVGGRGGHYTWMDLPNGTYTFTGLMAGSNIPVVIGSIFRASGGGQAVSTCIPPENAISGEPGRAGSNNNGGAGGGAGSPLGGSIFPGGNYMLFGSGGAGGDTGSTTAGYASSGLIWFEYKKQSPKLPKFIGLANAIIWSMRPDVNNLNSKQERVLSSEANAWQSVAYGNGTFVAVSSNGTNRVMTSTNGTSWTNRTASQANPWQSVAYGNGTFVAVSINGTNRVMTSTNGTSWTNRTASQANQWRSVAYGDGMFVAVSSNGINRVMTSPNGITWTNRTASHVATWRSVAYGNGVFIAVANSGNMMRSTDNGLTWSSVTVPVYNWRNLAYGDGIWVATTDDNMTTRDPSNYRTYRTMISNDNGLTWHLTDALMGADALCYVPEE